jgi:hypothetical protein
MVAYAITHVGGVLVEETLLPLVSGAGFWDESSATGALLDDGRVARCSGTMSPF